MKDWQSGSERMDYSCLMISHISQEMMLFQSDSSNLFGHARAKTRKSSRRARMYFHTNLQIHSVLRYWLNGCVRHLLMPRQVSFYNPTEPFPQFLPIAVRSALLPVAIRY